MHRREFICAAAIAAGSLLTKADAQPQVAPETRVCPKSRPPARAIFATLLEELTSFGWDVRLTPTCLQGIVNRSELRLYLIHDRYDDLWLDWLRDRGDVDKIQWLEAAQVFQCFLPEVSRMFLTDPRVPASVNVATMLAGIHSGLVVTPAVAHDLNRFWRTFGAS